MSIIDFTLEDAIQHEYLTTGGNLQIGEQLILSALKLGHYSVVKRIRKICTDVIAGNPEINGDDISTVLGHVLQRGLMEYGDCNKTQLNWLFRQGPRFKLDAAHLSSAIMNWDYEVLEMLLDVPLMRRELQSLSTNDAIISLWAAASARMEPVKFYELLLKSEAPLPSDFCFAKILEAAPPETVDVKWFVDHECSPNPDGPLWDWYNKQTTLAEYVCKYCASREKKYYILVEKMLAAGADPNTKIEAKPSILKFHGAYNIMDVAVDSKNEEMMDLLIKYKAKPTDPETRKNHYIEIMEKSL